MGDIFSQKPIRILHLPTGVGHSAWNLAKGERKHGCLPTVLLTTKNILTSDCDIYLKATKIGIFDLVRRMLFCVFNARKYDVIHYNWGTPLINLNSQKLLKLDEKLFGSRIQGWDVRYFKRRKKVIAVTYQGSDSRQAGYCVEHFKTTFYTKQDAEELKDNDAFLARRIAFFDRYADLIYATNPDLLQVLPARAVFRPYTKLQPEDYTPSYSDYTKKTLVIVHAPTKTKVKGSSYVIDAVERLKSDGYDIDFKLVQNIPNSEALEIYRNSDLIVDQLLAGWYGGFAVEAMAMGKPVVSYLRESDFGVLPDDMRRDMPIINADPKTIYAVLKDCCEHRQQLADIARRSRAYVEKYHDSIEIAAGIVADYRAALAKKEQ